MARLKSIFNPCRFPAEKRSEQGQVLVIAAMMLVVLALTLLFYLSLQRALSLKNFLDETAEMMSQAALRPKTDINGQLILDTDEALSAATAALEISLVNSGELTADQRNTLSTDFNSQLNGNGITFYAVGDDCSAILGGTGTNCLFPAAEIELALPHELFNVSFTIRSRAVSTLGDNPETIDLTPRSAITVPAVPTISSGTIEP